MDSPDLKAPQHYINREFSFLEFNQRVLDQAFDKSVPLLERLRFLCIASTNLDEFFEIRVAGLKQRLELGVGAGGPGRPAGSRGPHGPPRARARTWSPSSTAAQRGAVAGPGEGGHPRAGRSEWNAQAQRSLAAQVFRAGGGAGLSPMGLDPAHPFPRILNKSLNFIVSLEGKDAFGRNSGMAVVQAPRSLPRVIQMPRRRGAATVSCCCPRSSMPTWKSCSRA